VNFGGAPRVAARVVVRTCPAGPCNYVDSTGLKGFREVAKLLCANEREFSAWLDASGITYRLAGERTAHKQHELAGRFVTKAGTTGEGGHSFTQLKFTAKGVSWIVGEWAKHKIKEVATT
jgi:phage antirepressor YoqD-like protein